MAEFTVEPGGVEFIIGNGGDQVCTGGGGVTLEIGKATPDIEPSCGGVEFTMVAQVLGGGRATQPRLTQDEYDALPEKDQSTLYLVVDENDSLIRIYVGYELIAEADESGAFTYTFPFTLS